jgi:aminopeptidase N
MTKRYLQYLLAAAMFTVTLVLAQTSNQVPTEQPLKNVPVSWSRVRTFDVKHSALDLRFDWTNKNAFGTATITLALFRPSNVVQLDAAKMTIYSITTANGLPLKYSYDGSERDGALAITLDHIYPAGDDLTLQIKYRTNWLNQSDPNNLAGSNGLGLRFLQPTSTEPTKRRQIWAVGEPQANRYWYPGYDAPNDLRSSELRATVARGLIAISNGELVEKTENNDGTTTFHWQMPAPHAHYKTSLVIGEYVDFRQGFQGIALHNYGYADQLEPLKTSVARLPDMLNFYSNATGVKYPYSSYAQVFVQDFPWGAANIAVSTQTENMFDDEPTHAEWRYLWDGLQAESLAGQWFGNYLSIKDWSQTWLSRGFSHYFDELYNEHKNGQAEFLLWPHAGDLSTYLADWQAGVQFPVINNRYDDAAAFQTSNYPYVRAALVLHMLRKHLGEQNWWKAIRIYVQNNGGKFVSTQQFQDAIEEASGESMDWFFDQWLYKIGHPVFVVEKKYDEAEKQLQIHIKQTQTVNPASTYPQVELFAGKMDIEIDQSIQTVWLEAKADNEFSFDLVQAPKLVNVDYQSTWIKEMTFKKSLDELIYQSAHDTDVVAKTWALGELAKLAKVPSTSASDNRKLLAALRAALLDKTYWRLRGTAVAQLRIALTPDAADVPLVLDAATEKSVLLASKDAQSWVRVGAINLLGLTRQQKFADLYIQALTDPADRVVNAAANALGKSHSPKAFAALVKLLDRPSWKSQSLVSTLNGLKELGDPRGADIANKALADLHAPRWTLASPTWDYRIAAAQTLVALGQTQQASEIILQRFNKSLEENDVNDIFSNVLLLATLGDPSASQIFALLKARYKDDADALNAVSGYEKQFLQYRKKS